MFFKLSTRPTGNDLSELLVSTNNAKPTTVNLVYAIVLSSREVKHETFRDFPHDNVAVGVKSQVLQLVACTFQQQFLNRKQLQLQFP